MDKNLTGFSEMTVTEKDTAKAVGSGELDVLATPVLAALIEKAALNSISGIIENGFTTVGTKLELDHLAPTPVGGKTRCECTLTEADGRKMVFRAEVFDGAGKICSCFHERFIVNKKKFMEKASTR